MADPVTAVAAVDLGASSGRVVAARFADGQVTLDVVHRFPNGPVHTADGLRWDVERLFDETLTGLAAARRATPIATVGIDSWAVDYGLLADGRLLDQPFHYRDDRTAVGVDAVHASITPGELFAVNGLQFLPFNTLYQLTADRLGGRLDGADTALLIPDLLAFWLTGIAVTERTNASTTGLLDVRSRDWHEQLRERLALPALFPPLVDAGTTIGRTTADITAHLRCELTVTAVGSHDTASAVAAVPMDPTRAVYISCGTWALVGVELEHPNCSAAAHAANFTNELGVDGRVRFLRNVMGLWMLDECIREWQAADGGFDLAALLGAAAANTDDVPRFDVDDPIFLAPGSMEQRIVARLVDAGTAVPRSRAAFVRCVVENIAAALAAAVEQVGDLTGVEAATVHVVGGGARNELLCAALARRCGRPVLAGPVEATALGNALVAARGAGIVDGGLDELRAIVARSTELRHHEPST